MSTPSSPKITPAADKADKKPKDGAPSGRGGRGGRGGGSMRGRGAAAAAAASTDAPTDAADETKKTEGAGRGRGGAGRGRGGSGRGGRGGKRETGAPAGEKKEGDDTETADETNENGEKIVGGRKREWKLIEKPNVPSDAEHTKILWELEKKAESFDGVIAAEDAAMAVAVERRKAAREPQVKLVEKLREIRARKDEKFQQSKAFGDEIKLTDEERKKKRAKLDEMKKELKFTDLSKLDEYIAKIEYSMSHGTLSLNEEKKRVNELKSMKAQRVQVLKYNELMEDFSTDSYDTSDIKAARAQISKLVDVIKVEETMYQKELDKLRAAEKDANTQVEKHIERKRELNEEKRKAASEHYMCAKNREWQKKLLEKYEAQQQYLERKRVRDERTAKFEAQKEEWKRQKKERAEKKRQWEAQKEERQRQWEEQKAQRQADKEAWEALMQAQREEQEAEEAAKDPWEKEKDDVDGLVRYLVALQPKDESDDNASTNANNGSQLVDLNARNSAFKGVKKVDPLDNRAKHVPQAIYDELVVKKAAPKKVKRKVNKTITHIPDIFALFAAYGVQAPLLTDDIPAALEALRAKREWYNTAPRPEKKKKEEEKPADEEAEATEETGADGAEKKDGKKKKNKKNKSKKDGEPAGDAAAADKKGDDVHETKEESKQRAAARKQAKKAVDEEQRRRVDEASADETAAAEERKANQAAAKSAVEKEQADRVASASSTETDERVSARRRMSLELLKNQKKVDDKEESEKQIAALEAKLA